MQRPAVLFCIFCAALAHVTFAGVAQPLNERPVSQPFPCNTGPTPNVKFQTLGAYVHVMWDAVPGAVEYVLERHNSEGDGNALLESSRLDFWDAVDLGTDYEYTIIAYQAKQCGLTRAPESVYGQTSGTVTAAASTPNPAAALGKRTVWTHGQHNGTDGVIMWSPVFGAIAYRIDGPGIASVGLLLGAGTYRGGINTHGPSGPGESPVAGPYSPLLISNNTDALCPTCSLAFEPSEANASGPLVGMGPGEYDYKITAIYPGTNAAGNNADYYHPAHAIIPSVPLCSVSRTTPTSGRQGDTVTLAGQAFTYARGVSADGIAQNLLAVTSDSEIDVIVSTSIPQNQNVRFVVDTLSGTCTSPDFFVVATPPPPSGGLTATVIKSASQGEVCTGSAIVVIQPQMDSNAGNNNDKQTKTVGFSGLAEWLGSYWACSAGATFSPLTPENWVVQETSPVTSGKCVAAVVANQFSGVAILDGVCQ